MRQHRIGHCPRWLTVVARNRVHPGPQSASVARAVATQAQNLWGRFDQPEPEHCAERVVPHRIAACACPLLKLLQQVRPLPLKRDGKLAEVMQGHAEHKPVQHRAVGNTQRPREKTQQAGMSQKIGTSHGRHIQTVERQQVVTRIAARPGFAPVSKIARQMGAHPRSHASLRIESIFRCAVRARP